MLEINTSNRSILMGTERQKLPKVLNVIHELKENVKISNDAM